MRDTEELRSVLCDHKWSSSGEWVSALDELAKLTDNEIVQLQRFTDSSPLARKVEEL